MTADNTQNIWELTPTQRGLVDNCFEEGQYETAIGTLDQLRASEFKPWPPHLRQLIYISLQSAEEPTKKNENDTSIQTSPSKIIKQQQIQISLNPIPANVVFDAQRLLMAYLRTSLPSTLSRALPQRRSQAVQIGHNEGDSMVARRAAYITQCQDCWELLRSDLSLQKSPIFPAPVSKNRKHLERVGTGNFDSNSSEPDPSVPVAENAWPLLEWLVSLFERDEASSEITGETHYSLLLVDQLLDREGKAHIKTPIAIIVYCLAQEEPQRQRLANRLLSLLVNSTAMMELDLNTLINTIYTRIQSLDQLALLLSQLGHSATIQVLKFRIGSCQKVIGGSGLAPQSNAPKPQPRIRQRPTTKATDVANSLRDLHTAEMPAPPASEILRLFQAPMPATSFNSSFFTQVWFKFQLLLAYGALQERTKSDDRDAEWVKALAETLPQTVREVMEQQGTEANMYQRLLESQIVAWKQSLCPA